MAIQVEGAPKRRVLKFSTDQLEDLLKNSGIDQEVIDTVVTMVESTNGSHPEGGIAIREAARKYHINDRSLARWARSGLIKVLKWGDGQGSRTYLDEESVKIAVPI